MQNTERLVSEHSGQQTSMAKVAFAAFMGTAIEYYDFYIYGTAAALVFGTVFFPELSPVVGTIAAFATFGVAFVARPLGSIIFGHYGDKLGRKTMLVVSLLMMGVATILVGLLPGYATIGVAAPLLLVALRFIQGIGFGGEWGGAVLLATEYAPPGRRAFYSSFVQVGPVFGFLASSGIFLLVSSTLSQEQFVAWGWRIPFVLSIVLVAVGLFIRVRIAETPVFQQVLDSQSEARTPIAVVFRMYPKTLALATGAATLIFAFFYISTAFMLSYGTGQVGVSQSTMLYCTMIAIVFMGPGVLGFAAISDRIGRRNLLLASTAFMGLWAFPLFWLVNTGRPVLITLALAVGFVAFSGTWGPMGAFFSELFGTRVRYSGAGLSFNLGGIFGAALAPIVATQLLASTGASWSISGYLAVVAIVSFVSIFLLSESRGVDLSEEQTEGRTLLPEGQVADGSGRQR
jgi:metabolite-proton symporter